VTKLDWRELSANQKGWIRRGSHRRIWTEKNRNFKYERGAKEGGGVPTEVWGRSKAKTGGAIDLLGHNVEGFPIRGL